MLGRHAVRGAAPLLLASVLLSLAGCGGLVVPPSEYDAEEKADGTCLAKIKVRWGVGSVKSFKLKITSKIEANIK